jgi:DNA-binding NtrC family response regulator
MEATGKIRLLIVDDNQETRELLKETLGDKLYSYFEAANGLEALDILSQNTVDLIIADEVMPKLSGRQLFAQARGKGIMSPFIIMTGLRSYEVDFSFIEGFDPPLVLEKPFASAKLRDFMDRSLYPQKENVRALNKKTA